MKSRRQPLKPGQAQDAMALLRALYVPKNKPAPKPAPERKA